MHRMNIQRIIDVESQTWKQDLIEFRIDFGLLSPM